MDLETLKKYGLVLGWGYAPTRRFYSPENFPGGGLLPTFAELVGEDVADQAIIYLIKRPLEGDFYDAVEELNEEKYNTRMPMEFVCLRPDGDSFALVTLVVRHGIP